MSVVSRWLSCRVRPGLAGVLALVACGGEPRADTPPPAADAVAVDTAGATDATVTVETTTVEVPLSLPAQLYVENDAVVHARSAGVVESVLVDLGRRVAAGTVLARLESADQSITLAEAEERLANTTRTLERQRMLSAGGWVARVDSEQVAFERGQATLELRRARRAYDLTRIVAPFAGVVTARYVRRHRLVSAGDSLFRVTALAPLLAAVHLPEAVASGARVGSEAVVLGPDGRARARVIRASPVVDPGSGTRELVLQVDGGRGLTPGSSVTIRLGAERRRAVTVPRSAVAREGYALVRNYDRTVLRPVTLGADVGGGRVEVLSGLAPGEQVVRTAP